jgi:hypothetical protein
LNRWRDAVIGLGVTAANDALEIVSSESALEHERVVVVVREQLDQLNDRYCRAVLRTFKADGFEAYVDRRLRSGRRNLMQLLQPVLDAPDVEVIGVPFSRLGDETWTAGPVLITATRLLYKRMIRLGHGKDSAAAATAVRQLRSRAAEQAWDTESYWGWSPDFAASTAATFQTSNAELAQRLWGSEWPDSPVRRDETPQDLARHPTRVVNDVLQTIQDCIDVLATEVDLVD